jgi:hypothetical protein
VNPPGPRTSRADPAPIWQLYQTLAAAWSAMAITNEDAAAQCTDATRANLFRLRAVRAREHARRLQDRAEQVRLRRGHGIRR